LQVLLMLIAVALWAVVLLKPGFLSQFNIFLTMTLLGTVFLAAIWAAWRRFENGLQFLLCFLPLLGITFLLEIDRWLHIPLLDNWGRSWLMMFGSLFHIILLLGLTIARETRAMQREATLSTEVAVLRQQMTNLGFFVETLSRELEVPISKLERAVRRQKPAASAAGMDVARGELLEIAAQLAAVTATGINQSRLAAQSDAQFAATDIRALVAGVASHFQQHSPGHLLTYEPGELPDRFSCDARLVAIAITNLLDNAVRYSPAGSAIWISARLAAPGVLEIEVIDEGPGIRQEEQERIFSPCYGEGTATSRPGYGLGLFIVRRIAGMHGGSISLDSAEGEGATFVLRIPSVESQPD
ncbi:MAG: ATP-binding protein, partial [Haliea sp.]